MQPFPEIPEALLQELERRFPDKAPDLSLPEREVWARAGQAQLIRLLRSSFEEQNRPVIRKNP